MAATEAAPQWGPEQEAAMIQRFSEPFASEEEELALFQQTLRSVMAALHLPLEVMKEYHPQVDPAFRSALTVPCAVPEARVFDVDSGAELALSSAVCGDRATLLMFGSFTWPPFRYVSGAIRAIASAYAEHVALVVVYIREAHPVSTRADQPFFENAFPMPHNDRDGVCYPRPKTLDDRRNLARVMRDALGLDCRIVVDDMDDNCERAFEARPERLAVVRDGQVVYRSFCGPFGFQPGKLIGFLASQYGPKQIDMPPPPGGHH